MRAFLSHSSADKPFVETVARELGRQFCAFDQYEFESGEDLRTAIRKALDNSDLFVLFASKTSKERRWVDFEVEEAELRKIRGSMKRFLVIIIDDAAALTDIPEWLRRSRVRKLVSAKACAREIDYNLHELLRERQQPLFVGRTREIADAERQLIPIDGTRPPRVFLMFGLPGIGRRTLASRVARDILRLNKPVAISIESGDALPEVAIKLAEEVAPFGSLEEFKDKVHAFQSEADTQLISNIIDNLRSFVRNGEFPIFHDYGGLLDSDGEILAEFSTLLRRVDADGELYAALVTTRRPPLPRAAPGLSIPALRVSELQTDEIKRLLTSIAVPRGLKLSSTDISELAEYIRGYPPAAFYALELVARYGIQSAVSNQRLLIDFRTSFFLSSLAHTELDSKRRKQAMSILAFYGALPQAVLGAALDLSNEGLNDCLAYLYDCAFVAPTDDGYCALAEPLIDGVLRVFGNIGSIDHGKVADALETYLEEVEEDEKRLSVSRALFRALTLSGRGDSQNALALTTDFVRLTEDFYHDQDYEKAVHYGKIAVDRRPMNVDLRSFYVRALVKNENYAAAEVQIDEIRRLGKIRDAYFLTGFLECRRDRIREAIVAYEEAVRRGRTGVAISRELADCYFRAGDLENARKYIDMAQSRDPDNRYVVDLQIQIATNQLDEETARSRLRILQAVDRPEFYNHRLSVVEHAFGDIEAAYEAAREAVESTTRPTLAMLSQLAKCEIESGRLDEAGEHLNIIDRRFSRVKHDIKVGLRCKWEIARGEFVNALALWEQLHDKSKPVHKILRRDAIQGILGHLDAKDARRPLLQNELKELGEYLSSIPTQELDILVDEDDL